MAAALLESLSANMLTPSGVGEPAPVEFGWCGGRHVYDTEFDELNCVFGRSLLFGLRVDTNRVPPEIKRAYRAMAEHGYVSDSPTGFTSKREKTSAREEAEERCRQDLASGQFRRSRMLDVLWDLECGVVYAPAFSDANVTGLRELFESTFDLKLRPLSSGVLAYNLLDAIGRSRDIEDLKPSRFLPPPQGADTSAQFGGSDAQHPPVPWAHASSDPTDFIGNEFLLWLIWSIKEQGGEVEIGDGRAVAYVVDRTFEMECPWNVTGKQSLTMTAPTRSAEAIAAFRRGKWPRKAGLTLAVDGVPFEFSLQVDRLNVSGLKIQRPEEGIDSRRDLIEYRLAAIQSVDRAIQDLYGGFVKTRASSGWPAVRERISVWLRADRVQSPQAIELKPKSSPVPNVLETA